MNRNWHEVFHNHLTHIRHPKRRGRIQLKSTSLPSLPAPVPTSRTASSQNRHRGRRRVEGKHRKLQDEESPRAADSLVALWPRLSHWVVWLRVHAVWINLPSRTGQHSLPDG